MEKENYTRQEVLDLITNLLQFPDCLIDALQNELTDWDAENLLKLVEQSNPSR